MLTVVFDMDGVIFDTETVCLNVWKSLAEEFGFENCDEVFSLCIGCNRLHTIQILNDSQKSGFQTEEFLRRASERMAEVVKKEGMPVKPGAPELLRWLREHGAKIAVASSTQAATVAEELKMAGLYSYFDVVVGGDMVKKSKPEPDIYLYACSLLEEKPGECFAIEDSHNGIRSASEAKMRTLMVPDRLPATGEMEQLAEAILQDLYAVMAYFQQEK